MIRISVVVGGHEMLSFQQVRGTAQMRNAFALCRQYRDRYNRKYLGARAKVVQAIV